MKNEWKETLMNFLLLPVGILLAVVVAWLCHLVDPKITSNAGIAHDHMAFHSSWFEEVSFILIVLGFLVFFVWWVVRVIRFLRSARSRNIKRINILLLGLPALVVAVCVVVDYLT
ncbi:MAG: hypothetical protein AAF193_00525 [Bacteroidota bacterium]